MNMIKKNGGFTLVELIVVIAILAILAGVAVPAYSGYITKAKEAGDLQVLSTVNSAAQGLAAGKATTVTSITVTNAGVITVAPNTITEADIEALTGAITGDSFKSGFATATWSNTGDNANKWVLNKPTT